MGFVNLLRPSNLVLLVAAPFIIYLFASSSKYTRSLKAIVGVEPGALALFLGFLTVLLLMVFGLIIARWLAQGDAASQRLRQLALIALPVQIILIALVIFAPSYALLFAKSAVANAVDPFTSDWIVPTVRPRQLTPQAALVVAFWFRALALAYTVTMVVFLTVAYVFKDRVLNLAATLFLALNTIALIYLLFVAHWGFASGVAITFRAAIFAYVLAAILGLSWTGLQALRQGKRTILIYASISIVFLSIAAAFFSQPKESFVLVGTTDARVAIVKGTPQSMADTVRFGEYPGADGTTTKIRNAANVSAALDLVRGAENVSGAFVPNTSDWQDFGLIWDVEFLGSSDKKTALTFSTLGLLLLVLTLGAAQHRLHPLAVGSEFFVDTIRGIPMLVIILYIGLPLSGAIKDATGGGIDLTNMTRGIVAIAIGYSAYMAEIFRAGIESIPTGQTEAAKSLGLSRWHTARLIVLPQALRVVIPPLGNEFIAMIKDTSLLSILSVRDVTQRMREFQASSFLPFAPFNTAAILYVVITLCCASFLKWVERRYETPGH